MRCKICQRELEKNTGECGYCGTQVKKSRIIPLLLGIVIAVIVILIVLVSLLWLKIGNLNKDSHQNEVVTTEKTEVHIDEEEKQKNIIREYMYRIKTYSLAAEGYEFDEELLNYEFVRAVNYSDGVGYILKDLNENGVPELFIVTTYEDGGYCIYDTYTINEQGIPERLFDTYSMGYRINYVIGKNNTVIVEGSGGTSHSIELYEMREDCKMQQFLYLGHETLEGDIYYKGTTYENRELCDSTEWDNIIKNYPEDDAIVCYAINDLTALETWFEE
ncbi:MAG: hypothetical protein E7406_09245 [Ruminococcaceae bacterium]|nr:hypothetical protein [Oscillospiraceae bacterium]